MKQGRFTIPADAAFAEESLKIAIVYAEKALEEVKGKEQ